MDEATLEELAGKRAFDRGAEYFEDGHVVGLRDDDGVITARVRGTHDYRIKLWAAEEELDFECDCPVGERYEFCKHCVAVGLAWLERRKEVEPNKGKRRGSHDNRSIGNEEICVYLMKLGKRELIDLLLEHSESNPEFRDRLVLMAAEKSANAPDLAAFRAAIDKAIRHRGFLAYGSVPAYARRIETVVESLQSLLKNGHAKAVLELVEQALRQMEAKLGEVDDSDGRLAGILHQFQELHLAACHIATPEPRSLARFLFERESSSDWEVFLGAAARYAELLGEVGLAEYRKLTEARWAKLPVLAPGEKDSLSFSERWRITYMMETLAKQSGDVEALVAIKSRNLSTAFCFLEIAQTYKTAGNPEAALQWAERGLRAFPNQTDQRLREFLIEEYHRRKRHDDAVEIAWMTFCERPGSDAYVVLHNSASQAESWPAWRDKALARLRQEIVADRKQRANGSRMYLSAGHSELVSIYLWEKNPEAAWAEAQAGGCRNELWLRLADARQRDYPEDAIAVYTAQLERSLMLAEMRAYQESVGILSKIHKIQERIGKLTEFATLVQSIRTRHKARRNLMKLLDAQRW